VHNNQAEGLRDNAKAGILCCTSLTHRATMTAAVASIMHIPFQAFTPQPTTSPYNLSKESLWPRKSLNLTDGSGVVSEMQSTQSSVPLV
ncbi:Hypothetical predicted protein, partial [Marmota monax]